MSQVNQPPTGLQSFLGAQNFGVNPDNLTQQVVPVMDLTPFFGTQQVRYARGTGSINGKGIGATLQIPSGEAWYLLSLSVWCSLAFAGPMMLAISSRNLPSFTIPGTEHRLKQTARVSFLATELVSLTWQPAQPIVYEGGVEFLCRVDAAPGLGAEFFEITAQYYKLIV